MSEPLVKKSKFSTSSGLNSRHTRPQTINLMNNTDSFEGDVIDPQVPRHFGDNEPIPSDFSRRKSSFSRSLKMSDIQQEFSHDDRQEGSDHGSPFRGRSPTPKMLNMTSYTQTETGDEFQFATRYRSSHQASASYTNKLGYMTDEEEDQTIRDSAEKEVSLRRFLLEPKKPFDEEVAMLRGTIRILKNDNNAWRNAMHTTAMISTSASEASHPVTAKRNYTDFIDSSKEHIAKAFSEYVFEVTSIGKRLAFQDENIEITSAQTKVNLCFTSLKHPGIYKEFEKIHEDKWYCLRSILQLGVGSRHKTIIDDCCGTYICPSCLRTTESCVQVRNFGPVVNARIIDTSDMKSLDSGKD